MRKNGQVFFSTDSRLCDFTNEVKAERDRGSCQVSGHACEYRKLPTVLSWMPHFSPRVYKRDGPKCNLQVLARCRECRKNGNSYHFQKWRFFPSTITSQKSSRKRQQNTVGVKYVRVGDTLVQVRISMTVFVRPQLSRL